jgi:hypothetical protein
MCGSSIATTPSSSLSICSSQVLPLRDEPMIHTRRSSSNLGVSVIVLAPFPPAQRVKRGECWRAERRIRREPIGSDQGEPSLSATTPHTAKPTAFGPPATSYEAGACGPPAPPAAGAPGIVNSEAAVAANIMSPSIFSFPLMKS